MMTGKRQMKQLKRIQQMVREEREAYRKAGGAPRGFAAHLDAKVDAEIEGARGRTRGVSGFWAPSLRRAA
jgi:hypothetical protein